MRPYIAYGQPLLSDRTLSFLSRDLGDRTSLTFRASSMPLPRPDAGRVHAVEDYPNGPVLEIWRLPQGWHVSYAGWDVRVSAASVMYVASGPVKVRWEDVVERAVLPLWTLTYLPGVVALHGGAVAWEGRAWGVLGDSGAGKSSTTRALLGRGARIVSDDMVVLDAQGGRALPGAPTLRLWSSPEHGAIDSAPILGMRDKRWYRMEDALGQREACSIGAIVVLRPDADAPPTGALSPLSGVHALVSLLGQTFDLEDPSRAWAEDRLRRVRALVEGTPILECRYARSPDGEARQVTAILGLMRGV